MTPYDLEGEDELPSPPVSPSIYRADWATSPATATSPASPPSPRPVPPTTPTAWPWDAPLPPTRYAHSPTRPSSKGKSKTRRPAPAPPPPPHVSPNTPPSSSQSSATPRTHWSSPATPPLLPLPPSLTLPAPSDPTVLALGPQPQSFSFSRGDLARFREGGFDKPESEEGGARWEGMPVVEAAWRRWEEVGGLGKAQGTSCYAYDREGLPYKPDLAYIQLVKLVIAASPRKMLTLAQIYQAIEERWPYYRTAGSTWKNSIRHNLSLNDCFRNVERPAAEVGIGKGNYWVVVPDQRPEPSRRPRQPSSSAASPPRPKRPRRHSPSHPAPPPTYDHRALLAAKPADWVPLEVAHVKAVRRAYPSLCPPPSFPAWRSDGDSNWAEPRSAGPWLGDDHGVRDVDGRLGKRPSVRLPGIESLLQVAGRVER